MSLARRLAGERRAAAPADADGQHHLRRRARGRAARRPGLPGRPGRCDLLRPGDRVGRAPSARPRTGLALARGHGQAVLVADEGGLGLALDANRAALDLLTEAIERAGLRARHRRRDRHRRRGHAVLHAAAATGWHASGVTCRQRELIAEIADWCDRYPIVSVEDVLAEDDWDGWRHATARARRPGRAGGRRPVRHRRRAAARAASREGVANSVLVKVNQNGLVSGARAVVDLARAGRVPHRRLRAVRRDRGQLASRPGRRLARGQIKVGSTHRSERTAKWNRLLQLEATEHTIFAGPWPDGRPGKDDIMRTGSTAGPSSSPAPAPASATRWRASSSPRAPSSTPPIWIRQAVPEGTRPARRRHRRRFASRPWSRWPVADTGRLDVLCNNAGQSSDHRPGQLHARGMGAAPSP